MKKFGKLKVLKEVLQFSQSKYCNQAETVNSPTDFVFKKYAFRFLQNSEAFTNACKTDLRFRNSL